MRGGPRLGSWFAKASIPIVDDEGISSLTRAWHWTDVRAARQACERHAADWFAPHFAHKPAYLCAPITAHQITAIRHSMGGLVEARTPRRRQSRRIEDTRVK